LAEKRISRFVSAGVYEREKVGLAAIAVVFVALIAFIVVGFLGWDLIERLGR
jgi:hypothetical protein